jgi:hypothetical protein
MLFSCPSRALRHTARRSLVAVARGQESGRRANNRQSLQRYPEWMLMHVCFGHAFCFYRSYQSSNVAAHVHSQRRRQRRRSRALRALAASIEALTLT